MKLPAPASFLHSLMTAVRIGLNPETFFLQKSRTNKDTFFLSMPGLKQVMMTFTPAGAEEIFRAPDGVLTSSLPNPIEPLLGRQSLILLQGESHATERRLLKPAFQGGCLRSYLPLMQNAITKRIDQLSAFEKVDMRTFMHAITLDVIIEVVFGARDKETHQQFERAIRDLLKAFSPPLMLMPFLRRPMGGVGLWDRFLQRQKHFNDLLQAEIALARSSSEPRADMLASLAAMKDESGDGLSLDHLQSELTTLLAAGHETTANTLIWAIYLLATHPHICEKLVKEITQAERDDINGIMKLPYLDATLKEVLRLHPVVPLVMRSTVQACNLLGYDLPADQYVGIATYALHVNEKIWDNPLAFQPERFLNREYSVYEYVPFGGGNKKCLGYGFALFEMKLTLFLLLSRMQFSLLSSELVTPAIQGITVGPRQKIQFTVLPR